MMQTKPSSAVTLRPPDLVMRLARLGAFHQTRLSFMRALLRQVQAQKWRIQRTRWSIDSRGVGVGVYQVSTNTNVYSLVCFARDLPDHLRTDRVIAEAWDASFVLFDGIPSEQDIDRLAVHTPKQEAGRFEHTDLVLSRANRSVRLFNHVVDRLASGKQPDKQQIVDVGYLMRTTAVYGNGKFGIADRDVIAGRTEFRCAFRAELLAVWLIRTFTVDLVEELAQLKNPDTAVKLDRSIKRLFGVGNSTGLGMAPFIVRHPGLFSRWIEARETALQRVRELPSATDTARDEFFDCLDRFTETVRYWNTADEVQNNRIAQLSGELPLLRTESLRLIAQPHPWDAIYRWAEKSVSLETQELTVSLLIEPHGELVDELAQTMEVDESESTRIDGRMSLASVKKIVRNNYAWALPIDYRSGAGQARFWYYSEEKLEPRLGERAHEPGAELELPLAVGRDIRFLHDALQSQPDSSDVASFLLLHPEHRHIVRRLQASTKFPYGEIQDNLIDADLRPVDMLRCKLSFFGASRFDPKSDRWVRITMYQGAPYPDEIADTPADTWAFSPLGRQR